MRRLLAVLFVALVAACATLGQEPAPKYYVSQVPYTFEDSTAEKIFVMIEDNTLVRLNAIMSRAYADGREEAACLRVAKPKSGTKGILFLDSLIPAKYLAPPTRQSAKFECATDQAVIHWHIVDWSNQCVMSTLDTQDWWSKHPAALLMCGYGIDSIVAVKVRHRGQR